MTDQTTTTTAATTSAPASTAAPAAATTTTTTDSTNATVLAGTTEPSSSTPAPGQEAPKEGASTTESGEAKPAQGEDPPNTDDPDKGDQSSEDKKTEDGEADKPGEDEGEGKPEAQTQQYEAFAVPEGLVLDEEALGVATPILQELNANQEQAQKLVDVASSMISKAMKKASDDHNAVRDGWANETKTLFGKDGDAEFSKRQEAADKVVGKFFTPEQRDVLTHYGLGNHPGFFAMAYAIAQATTEDTTATQDSKNGMSNSKSLSDTWYPAT